MAFFIWPTMAQIKQFIFNERRKARLQRASLLSEDYKRSKLRKKRK